MNSNQEQLVRKVKSIGNGAHVFTPKEWINEEVLIVRLLKSSSIKEEILKILSNYTEDILGVYLVGSYARHEESKESDIDVLVITFSINKKIKQGKYEIILISKDLLEKQLQKNILPLLPMLKESKPLINSELIKDYKKTELTRENLKFHIETTKSALKVIKSALELEQDKISDNIVYSLILRLREVYIVDYLIKNKHFVSAEEAIAYEFGYFLEYTKKLAITNGDSELIQKQLKRTKTVVKNVSIKSLKDYKIFNDRTEFIIEDKKYSINFIVPKDVFYSIQMTNLLMETLNLPFDPTFKNLILPPGRNSVFKGVKNITIIDSTYNATPDGVKTVLEMFEKYPSKNKWIVLGDMIELGDEEKEEHEKLAEILDSMNAAKIILIGPRVSKYTYPKLNKPAGHFLLPKDGLNYILKNIKGGETILFKGARFLEGIIEHLLQNKNDIDKLVRREKVWQNRRKAWGL